MLRPLYNVNEVLMNFDMKAIVTKINKEKLEFALVTGSDMVDTRIQRHIIWDSSTSRMKPTLSVS